MDPLTATIAPDPLGVLVAFGAGILSFLSPCVLPLVPGYVCMVSGLSAAELTATRGSATATATATAPAIATAPAGPGPSKSPEASVSSGMSATSVATLAPAAAAPAASTTPPTSAPSVEPSVGSSVEPSVDVTMRPVLRGIGLFIAGFTVVFVALGAAASGIGRLLVSHKETLTHVSGFVVILLGLVLLLGAVPSRFWARVGAGPLGVLTRVTGERRFDVRPSTLGTWAAPVMGMAFAFAWTPCIGPVLAAVLALAYDRSTLSGGVVLLFAYSLGLGVPFLVTGLAFNRLTSFYGRARRGLWIVHLVAGGVLVAFGILLLTGQLSWLSSQFSDLLNHLGLERLTRS
jgi:cytochrome c-type biogenesis protein